SAHGATMSRLWGRSIAAMSGAYSACAVTCWTHGRGQKMPPAKSSSSSSVPSKATTVRYRFQAGCCGWLATNALTLCGASGVDGELAVDEARRLRDHLATCQRCRELVDALRAENRVLGESLHELPEEAADPVGFPRLRLSRVWGDLAALAAVLALVSVFSAWVDKLRIPEALEWLNPFSADGLTNLIFNLSYYFAHGGTAMLADYAAVVGGLFLLLGGGALLLGRRWRLHQPGLRLLIVL